MGEILVHEQDPDWHHSDEENFFDAEKRARKALDHLRQVPQGMIVVVTHEHFLKLLISAMAVEDPARTVALFCDLRNFMTGENTGITMAKLIETEEGKQAFKLHIWNDHAHLG